jgi:hypothetical protein
MITQWHVQWKGQTFILGIAVERAVLDIVSDHALAANCLHVLESSPHKHTAYTRLGQFGEFPATLVLEQDDTVSIFIDGPQFETTRSQSAAICVEKDKLRDILREVILKMPTRAEAGH